MLVLSDKILLIMMDMRSKLDNQYASSRPSKLCFRCHDDPQGAAPLASGAACLRDQGGSFFQQMKANESPRTGGSCVRGAISIHLPESRSVKGACDCGCSGSVRVSISFSRAA